MTNKQTEKSKGEKKQQNNDNSSGKENEWNAKAMVPFLNTPQQCNVLVFLRVINTFDSNPEILEFYHENYRKIQYFKFSGVCWD